LAIPLGLVFRNWVGMSFVELTSKMIVPSKSPNWPTGRTLLLIWRDHHSLALVAAIGVLLA